MARKKKRSTSFELPSCLDMSAAPALKSSLLALRGGDAVLDAGTIQRMGAQCVQVLVSAKRTWEADGHGFSIVNPTTEFLECLSMLGIGEAELSIGGTAK